VVFTRIFGKTGGGEDGEVFRTSVFGHSPHNAKGGTFPDYPKGSTIVPDVLYFFPAMGWDPFWASGGPYSTRAGPVGIHPNSYLLSFFSLVSLHVGGRDFLSWSIVSRCKP